MKEEFTKEIIERAIEKYKQEIMVLECCISKLYSDLFINELKTLAGKKK